MRRTRGSKRLFVAAALLTSVGAANAQDSGWYAGAGGGAARAKINDTRIEGGLSQVGLVTTSIQNNDSDSGFKVFGGYQFTPNFALEGSFFDLGKFSFRANTNPIGTLDGSAHFIGAGLDAVGRVPIGDRFSVFGKLGVTEDRTSDDFFGTGNVHVLAPHTSEHGTNYKFGFGAQYALTSSWSIRAEAERYRAGDAVGNHGDIDLFSMSLVYQFGSKAGPTSPPVVETFVPPAPAAPPPPVSAVVPTPQARSVTISADSLFEFGQARLSVSGRLALDQFVLQIKGANISQISITGHTDRLGGAALNQALSQRRADAVKNYLQSSTGLAEGTFVARGLDGKDPVTKPGDCIGSRATPALIGCLQPDRRVEVSVTLAP